MGQLDMHELMGDLHFMEAFNFVRSVRTVGNDGLTVDTPNTIGAFGTLQPSSPNDLKMLPEAERIGSFINVITATRLVALSDTTAADVVLWEDKQWRVKQVNDWSSWGSGFVNAICELTDLVVRSPTPEP